MQSTRRGGILGCGGILGQTGNGEGEEISKSANILKVVSF